MSRLGIIGRDRQIVQTVAKRLHGVISGESTDLHETARGYRFDLRDADNYVVRVTVELERIEQPLTTDEMKALLKGAQIRIGTRGSGPFIDFIVTTSPHEEPHPVVTEAFVRFDGCFYDLLALLEKNPLWKAFPV